MSIAGVSGVSSAAYLQQLQNTAQTNATAQAATPQSATLASSTAPAGATQQTGQVHHHHHHHGGGGAATQSSDVTQTGTDATGGTSLLNTLV